MMTTPKKIEKLYIITKDKNGKLHHYVSKKASMHCDIVLEFDIDLDIETVIEKGFISGSHKITANFNVKGDQERQQINKRHNDRK